MVPLSAIEARDLEFLLASGRLDLKKTRTIVSEHLGPYAAQEFDALVQEIAWKKKAGKI